MVRQEELSLTDPTRTIFKDGPILGYFRRLICHNFCIMLTKVAKLHFFGSGLKFLKTDQKSIHTSTRYEITDLGNIEKNYFFKDVFLIK